MNIEEAQNRLQTHWASIPTLPYSPTFEGCLDDIQCLDYLHFEGIPYVNGDDETDVVGTFWGHVYSQLTGLVWATDEEIGLPFLAAPEEQCEGFRLYPTIRVREAIGRSVPQFGKLAWALSAALFEFTQQCINAEEVIERAVQSAIQKENDYISAVRAAESEIRQ